MPRRRWVTDAGELVAPGPNSNNVTATAGTTEIAGTPLVARAVEGVARDGGSTRLVLSGGLRVPYAEVKQIL